MRILLLTNPENKYARDVLALLERRGHDVWTNSELVGDDRFPLVVSWFYNRILDETQINEHAVGVVNCHPALLPFGRGAMPNVWSIVDKEPAGVTLHWIDAGVDTGDVIAQMSVPSFSTDTGESLYRRLENALYNLFVSKWPEIEREAMRGNRIVSYKQPGGVYKTHKRRDVADIDDLGKLGTVAYRVVDILRARTFPPHEAAYIYAADGRKISVKVSLEYAD